MIKLLQKISPRFWFLVVVCVLIIFCVYGNIFQSYELLGYDFLMKHRPAQKINDDIVIVEVAQDTLKELKNWPLPRNFHAVLVDILRENGAKKIIFDILFSEPAPHDDVFSLAIKKSGSVYMPCAFSLTNKFQKDVLLLSSHSIEGGVVASLGRYAAGIGNINIFTDPDGKIRRIPLFIRHNNRLIPHLGLKVAMDSLNLDLDNVALKTGRVIIDNKFFIPISRRASFYVNYPGPWTKTFRHFSYLDIIKAYGQQQAGLKPILDLSVFKNKICFIGLTAAGTVDLKSTPLENAYPLVGLHASVFNSILEKKYIIDIGVFPNAVIGLIVFFLSLFICLRLFPVKAFLVEVSLAVGYFFLAVFVFGLFGYWLALFTPLIIMALTYVGVLLYRFLNEARQRELMEKELEIAAKIQKSFLPKNIHEFPGIEISSFMMPAKFVAGDLYDVVPLDNGRLGIFMGDVSGKGVPAALIMAQTVSLFRLLSRRFQRPSEVLGALNEELAKILEGRFVTALYVIVDLRLRLIEASCAGHLPMLFYESHQNRVTEFLPVSGPALGLMPSSQYEDFNKTIQSKDKICIYTDGITEARNSDGNEFGVQRVKDILAASGVLSMENISARILEEVEKFQGIASPHDDMAVILFGL